uniref:Ribosome biogenesis protein SLX9 n=1 Tax=Attheya septentrionalis TaxID=420275 RepID=A0A6T7FVL8_9STRA|mmetsp:Transcript_15650/g.28450  ORF Transcript_15650/g.28450 Transcript_15650/m.28450 type:complete len:228 (+) Transcript_15650:76-759(+)
MPSIATLLAAGATLVSDKHVQGKKRKPLGDITPHPNARKTKKKLKAKIHRLTKDEKIISAAEREFISSLCKQLEDDAIVYHAAKSKPNGDTPRIRYGAVSNLVTSLKPTYHFLSIPKINNTLATRRLLREKAEHSKHQENTPSVNTRPPVEIDTPLNADTPPHHALEMKSKFGRKPGLTNKKKQKVGLVPSLRRRNKNFECQTSMFPNLPSRTEFSKERRLVLVGVA